MLGKLNNDLCKKELNLIILIDNKNLSIQLLEYAQKQHTCEHS
jgi:hypothetical protein